MLPRLFSTLLYAALGLAIATSVRAELILDDFNDPAEVTEISRGSTPLSATTEQVGDLEAKRSMTISAVLNDPTASFSSNIGVTSGLSAKLDGHMTERPPQVTIISFTAGYAFTPLDLTENSSNNAFLFDFASHEGNQLPTFFRVIARGLTGAESYAAVSADFGFSSDPFTATIPFDAFTIRGGPPAMPDVGRFQEIFVNFYFINPREDIHWAAHLDRIRIGRVPEPAAIRLGGAGGLLGLLRRRSPVRFRSQKSQKLIAGG